MAAIGGPFLNAAAAILPPNDCVYWSSLVASTGVQTPAASRTPTPVAKELTSLASIACAKSITPFHCGRVSTPPNPAGGTFGAGVSESWKYVVFAQVPLTRT